MTTQTMSEMKAQVIAKADEDEAFRARLLADPKSVISAEFGITIPEGFDVQVHEDGASTAHFILPPSPRLTEEDLAMVAGGGWLDNAARGGQGGP